METKDCHQGSSPKEHERIRGKSETYECFNNTTHCYLIIRLDGSEEWKTLHSPLAELVGWVQPEEERLVSNPLNHFQQKYP
jgi:hypothetical protein